MRDIGKELRSVKITEQRVNRILPAKHYSDNVINVTAGPKPTYIRVDIDADIITLGLAVHTLMKRYKHSLDLMIYNNIIPSNTDELIKEQVYDYTQARRSEISIVRKDDKDE